MLILLKPRINSLDGICFFQNGNPHFDDQNQQNGFQNQQNGSQNRQRGTQNQQSGTQNQQSGKARINKSGRATYMLVSRNRVLEVRVGEGVCGSEGPSLRVVLSLAANAGPCLPIIPKAVIAHASQYAAR